MIVRRSASTIQPGDVMPAVTFGRGAVVASVTPDPLGRNGTIRVAFTEPVQSRYSPDRTIYTMSFYPDDMVFVRAQCEAEWPSPVTGGMTDARCANEATTAVEGVAYCAECAGELVKE